MAERDDEFVIAPPIEGSAPIQIDMTGVDESFSPPIAASSSAPSDGIEKARAYLRGLEQEPLD